MWQLEARVFPSGQAPFPRQSNTETLVAHSGHRSDSRILASASSDGMRHKMRCPSHMLVAIIEPPRAYLGVTGLAEDSKNWLLLLRLFLLLDTETV